MMLAIRIFSQNNSEVIGPDANVILTITSEPPGAGISVDGKEGGITPKNLNLTAGEHTVQIGGDSLEYWTNRYSFKPGQIQSIHVMLARKRGFIKISTDMHPATVFIDDSLAGITPHFVKSLPYGEHRIVVMHPLAQKPFSTVLRIQKPDTTVVDAWLNKAWVHITGGVRDSEVRLNGRPVGRLPVPHMEIKAGKNKFEFHRKGFETKKVSIQPNAQDTIRLRVEQKPLRKTKAVVYSFLIPGGGQLYRKNFLKSALFSFSESSCMVMCLLYDDRMKMDISEYDIRRAAYSESMDDDQIESLRMNMHAAYEKVEKSESMRNAFIYIAAGLWLLNIIDSYVSDNPISTPPNHLGLRPVFPSDDPAIPIRLGITCSIPLVSKP
jgi:hypothetical protein